MTRELMQQELLNIIARTGNTVLFVTHSIDEALQLGDRIVMMTARPGRIEAVLPVTLPKPRTGAGVEQTLVSLRHQIWARLKDEAERAVEAAP